MKRFMLVGLVLVYGMGVLVGGSNFAVAQSEASAEPEEVVEPCAPEVEIVAPEPEEEPTEESSDEPCIDGEPEVSEEPVVEEIVQVIEPEEVCVVYGSAVYNGGIEPGFYLNGMYADVFRVISVERDENDCDLVTIKDPNGWLNQFVADGSDWCVGDGCAAIMGTNGTPEVFDDMILAARYIAW